MVLRNTAENREKFVTRTQNHINLVNKYAKKVGYKFPDHDSEKITKLVNSYCLFVIPNTERTDAEKAVLGAATLLHVLQNPHHPEFWTETSLDGFTRENFTPNGPVEATKMPEIALIEMVADWCAVAEEKGTNTPLEWFERVNGKRWIFTNKQQEVIKDLISQMW